MLLILTLSFPLLRNDFLINTPTPLNLFCMQVFLTSDFKESFCCFIQNILTDRVLSHCDFFATAMILVCLERLRKDW